MLSLNQCNPWVMHIFIGLLRWRFWRGIRGEPGQMKNRNSTTCVRYQISVLWKFCKPLREQHITHSTYYHCFVSVTISLMQMLRRRTAVFVVRKQLPSFTVCWYCVCVTGQVTTCCFLISLHVFIDSVKLEDWFYCFFLRRVECGWMKHWSDNMLNIWVL